MFARRMDRDAFIQKTLQDVRGDCQAIRMIALDSQRWRKITEKERYYVMRREAITLLAFGLAFDRLRLRIEDFDCSPDSAAAYWRDRAYEHFLPPSDFTALQEVFYLHRRRAAWNDLWEVVARNAHTSAQRCIDPVRQAPRLTFVTFQHEHFYSMFYDYSEAGSEDPNSFWVASLVPRAMAYARLDPWPQTVKRLKPVLMTCFLQGLA